MKMAFPKPGRRDWTLLGVVAGAFFLAWLLYPESSSSRVSEERESIVLWLMPQPDFMVPYTATAREFERLHPEYSVQVGSSITRDTAGDPTRFLLGVAGGEPPDVIFFDRFAIVEWAARGAFTDLNPYVQRDRETGHPDGIREEDFFDVAWQEPVYQDQLFAIPTDTDTRALYYSDSALQRAGLVYGDEDPEVVEGRARPGDPRPPKTWEEMSRKLGHFVGRVSGDGSVELTGWPVLPIDRTESRREEPVDLSVMGIRAGDVIALVTGDSVFRGRIAAVDGTDRLRIDLVKGLANMGGN